VPNRPVIVPMGGQNVWSRDVRLQCTVLSELYINKLLPNLFLQFHLI
jgi:hypothetical protein